MGPRSGLPAVGDRAGLGAAVAVGEGARRARPALGRARHRAGRRLVLVQLRGDRDRPVDVREGASFATAMVFQFASTNLVFEIGIVIWIFMGWQFTLAEFVGGIFLIAMMWLGTRLFITRRLEGEALAHAEAAAAGHQHASAASEGASWRRRLASVEAWADVAHNFRGDWGCSGRRSPPDS